MSRNVVPFETGIWMTVVTMVLSSSVQSIHFFWDGTHCRYHGGSRLFGAPQCVHLRRSKSPRRMDIIHSVWWIYTVRVAEWILVENAAAIFDKSLYLATVSAQNVPRLRSYVTAREKQWKRFKWKWILYTLQYLKRQFDGIIRTKTTAEQQLPW